MRFQNSTCNDPTLQAKWFYRVRVSTCMDLGDILSPTQILPEMKAGTRWEAIDELIAPLIASSKIKLEHREPITAVVKKREHAMSTGIGFGVGIPHASSDLIYEVVAVLGRSKQGINFDALDNQPVTLVVLFLVPQGQFQKHLSTLAKIAKVLHSKEFRQALMDAPDAAAMYEIIRSQSGGK
jgi:mannitol/fructose-specific phosphotransferase system IIA component (Ntr-type)